ncbi:MAG: stage III sporulation protein AA [Schaedlerella sp.]|nr:stage III sporulation protein AA [Schaedlerella sp.]
MHVLENEEQKEKQVLNVLAKSIRRLIDEERFLIKNLQEIRLRIGKPLTVIYNNQEFFLPLRKMEKHIVRQEELRETLNYISRYSLYAFESEIKQGFITIEGGHRVGASGKVILENDRVKNIEYISSLNIRVTHEIRGCADKVMRFITKKGMVCHTLIVSPPRSGKTTLIRDMVRQISDGNGYVKGCTVGVVDERSEIGGCYLGVPQNDLGMRTDILDCCPKSQGMLMLIRSMAPQVIAVDEIGTIEEIHSVEYAMQCGCKMIASVHGRDMNEVREKPILGELIKSHRFERYIVLKNKNHPGEIDAIYGERGNLLCKDL